jgi:hypothetical protein
MLTDLSLRRVLHPIVALVALAVVVAADATWAGEVPAAAREQLATAKYVYISSTRKDGSLSKPAEIWFMSDHGAVYVGTPPTSWRARRIKAGRPQAKIAVGKPDGPSFTATGAVVKDPALQTLMMETYAKKYPDGWPKYEQKFRSGFADGSRILIKYTPTGN